MAADLATPTQHDDLLSEHQNFGFKRRSRPKQVSDQAQDGPAEIPHPTQDCPIRRQLPTGSDLRQGQLGQGRGERSLLMSAPHMSTFGDKADVRGPSSADQNDH